MIISSGNITLDPTVTSLEGIFVSNTFQTGTTGDEDDQPLTVTGSVITQGDLSLQRDLGAVENVLNPAELFEFSPFLFLSLPSQLVKIYFQLSCRQ